MSVSTDRADVGPGYRAGILNHDLSTELDRLRLLEAALDPASRATLSAREIPPDARVLEVGAGAGSLASWLARRVPGGRVTAIDLNTGFLRGDRAPDLPPNLEVVEADVRVHGFPAGSFDLVHARTVLLHVPERDEVLRRLASWLSPGGLLVTEDLVLYPADSSPHPVFRRAFEAMEKAMVASMGTDLRWARSFPAPLARAGLVDVGTSAQFCPTGGGNEMGQMWRATFAQAADFLAASGLLAAPDLAQTLELLADPDFQDLGPSMMTAWGRAPF